MYKKERWLHFGMVIQKSNMNLCDHNKRTRVNSSAWLFWNVIVSMQTYDVVLTSEQNWVEKMWLVMILWCTHVVWQNLWASSPSFCSSKHHFSIFFSQLLNWRCKEDRIEIVCQDWKSAVFHKQCCPWFFWGWLSFHGCSNYPASH